MADDQLRLMINQAGRLMLNSLAVSVEHIRTCPRCERLFLVAFEASADQLEENAPAPLAATTDAWSPIPDVWSLIKEQLREFRQCAGWPKGA